MNTSDSLSVKTAKLSDDELKAQIIHLARIYSERVHQNNLPAAFNDKIFEPGISKIDYAARVFGPEEVEAAVGSALDFWLTLGEEGALFERELAAYLGIRQSLLVNSGSSANLVAISALTSPLAPGRRLKPGDEVITCAAGFPTTVFPIIQAGLVPVFVDNNPLTGNIDISMLEEAFDPKLTGAVMVAHTLGNPFDLSAVLSFCNKHDLWLIEDNCDALGSSYTMASGYAKLCGLKTPKNQRSLSDNPITQLTGTWGDLSTQSFYPPHHLTMGEGGAVNICRNLKLKRPAESFRDWGRDCWCPSGEDNTCGKRYCQQLGELPFGYDHKYTYSHLGYNLKPLDIQAAIGRVQLSRVKSFTDDRKANWARLRAELDDCNEFFDFMLPTHAKSWRDGVFEWDHTGCQVDPSWFGFMILVKEDAPFKSRDLAMYLDAHRIGNRMLFGGNLVKQPAFIQLGKEKPSSFRVVGDLHGADTLMNRALFIGTYPGLTRQMLDYEIDVIHEFLSKNT